MSHTAEMSDVLEREPGCDIYAHPATVTEQSAMSDANDHKPTSADDFADAAEPSLRAVLMDQIALLKSGELKTISREEWDLGIEETHRLFEKSRQPSRGI